MIKITLTTPALLFSATTLLLVAYTTRFLALAQLVRNLHLDYQTNRENRIGKQIRNIRRRLNLIRQMQLFGIFSILLCVGSMLLIYIGYQSIAAYIFGIALLLMIISLALSAWEINISVQALNLHLSDMEEEKS